MSVLGIESSCDETAAAVLDRPLRVRSNVVVSQIEDHRHYGGVVPELASRRHVEAIPLVLQKAMGEAGCAWDELEGIAVTRGPGLASSLMVGYAAARALGWRLGIPVWGVHHMEAHMLSLFLGEGPVDPPSLCPALILLATGGHTALVRMEAPGRYEVLGRSLDDAAGEALDKGAKLMGLPYPGGPEIEALAHGASRPGPSFPLGVPDGETARARGGTFAFSFSGLKTALRYHLAAHPEDLHPDRLPDVAAAYQHAVMETLLTRTRQALAAGEVRCLACVGGVARNQRLREGLVSLAARHRVTLRLVPPAFCTDNAAMVAAVALLRTCEVLSVNDDVHPNLPLSGVRLR